MITCLADWRAAIREWIPAEAVPEHPDFGVHYPWRALALYAQSSEHHRRVEAARRTIDQVPDVAGGWYLATSGGKDSTAAAAVLRGVGVSLPAMCALAPSVDLPGRAAYVRASTEHLGHAPHLLPVKEGNVFAEFARRGVTLDSPLAAGRAALEAGLWGNVGDWLEEHPHWGCVLGLRGAESKARRLNRATRGRIYRRSDGMTIYTPIADWSDRDVHAYLLARDIPVQPVYLCVDPGHENEGLSIRENSVLSSMGANGGPGRHGYFGWLRRWWPDIYARCVTLDPRIGAMS